MNVASTITKATCLATCIFWIFIFSEDFDNGLIPFVFLSMIPIGICCALTIIITVLPFFCCNGNKKNKRIVVKRYFPFYAIASFSLCFYGFIEESNMACFWIAAFFTSLQSWNWLANEKET